MKSKVRPSLIILWLGLALVRTGFTVSSNLKPDLQAIESMIGKIEYALNGTEDSSMVLSADTRMKLADLYSEKARALLQEGSEKKLSQSIQLAQESHRKALNIYISLLPLNKQTAYVRLQISQQHLALGQPEAALKYLYEFSKSAEFKKTDQKLVDEINFRIASLLEPTGNLTEALRYYDHGQTSNSDSIRLQSQYRKAWVLFNLGQIERAFTQLFLVNENNKKLNTPLYSDEDLLNDLIKIGAHAQEPSRLETVLQNIKSEKIKLSWTKKLIQELNHKGRADWTLTTLENNKNSFQNQNEMVFYYIHSFQALHMTGQKKMLPSYYQMLVKNLGNAESFAEHKEDILQIEKIIKRWTQEEKQSYSFALIETLKIHLSYKPDLNLSQHVSLSLKQQNKMSEAYWFYETTLNTLKNSKDSNRLSNLESFLQGKIEAAEVIKSQELRLKSYQDYLDYFPQGSTASEARYQIAHVSYEQKNWNKAELQFKELLDSKQTKRSIQLLAAHLYLDCLVLQNKTLAVATESRKLQSQLPENASEFSVIEINTVEKLVFQKEQLKLNETELKSLFARAILLSEKMTPRNRQTELQNQILFQFSSLQFYPELKNFSLVLLKKKDSSDKIKKVSLTALIQVSEIENNFKAALKYQDQLAQIEPLKKSDLYQKAIFQDLAQINSSKTYEQIWEMTQNASDRNKLAQTLFLKSSDKYSTLLKYKQYLETDKNFYQDALYTAYSNINLQTATKAKSQIEKWASSDSMVHSLVEIRKVDLLLTEYNRINYKQYAPETWASTNKKKNKSLERIENQFNQTVKLKNNIAQIYSLRILFQARKNYIDAILKLPAPKALKPAERLVFEKSREAKLKPDLQLLEKISSKLSALETDWIKSAERKNLDRWVLTMDEKTFQLTSKLIVHSFKNSSEFSSEKWLESSTGSRRKRASQLSLSLQGLSEEPNNIRYLANLKQSLMGSESGPVLAYLDNRLNQTK